MAFLTRVHDVSVVTICSLIVLLCPALRLVLLTLRTMKPRPSSLLPSWSPASSRLFDPRPGTAGPDRFMTGGASLKVDRGIHNRSFDIATSFLWANKSPRRLAVSFYGFLMKLYFSLWQVSRVPGCEVD